jgi:hypothetical protein
MQSQNATVMQRPYGAGYDDEHEAGTLSLKNNGDGSLRGGW